MNRYFKGVSELAKCYYQKFPKCPAKMSNVGNKAAEMGPNGKKHLYKYHLIMKNLKKICLKKSFGRELSQLIGIPNPELTQHLFFSFILLHM